MAGRLGDILTRKVVQDSTDMIILPRFHTHCQITILMRHESGIDNNFLRSFETDSNDTSIKL